MQLLTGQIARAGDAGTLFFLLECRAVVRRLPDASNRMVPLGGTAPISSTSPGRGDVGRRPGEGAEVMTHEHTFTPTLSPPGRGR